MKGGKPRRAGTKSGRRNDELPSDIVDAAEAALDDLLTRDSESDILERTERRPKMPLPAPPETQSVDVEAYEQTTSRAPTSTNHVGTTPLDALDVMDDDLDEEQVVAEVPALRVAVFEHQTYLRSAQSAIAAAGHVVALGAAGREGLAKIVAGVRDGSLDVVFATVPGGEAIIDAALAVEPRRPVVVACVDGTPLDAVQRASAAGADLVAIRPHDVGTIAPVMFAATRLTIERRLAAEPEPAGLVPFETFQRVLELAIVRAQKLEYPLSVALFAVEVRPPPPPGIDGIVRARAGNALINAIREIDVATQLDAERFLVLLPYTDLKRASVLAQKAIAAVNGGEPVVAAGRSYPPRIIGAIAAARLNQPVSVAKLVKDATRTLEQARRDGADLAVQP